MTIYVQPAFLPSSLTSVGAVRNHEVKVFSPSSLILYETLSFLSVSFSGRSKVIEAFLLPSRAHTLLYSCIGIVIR